MAAIINALFGTYPDLDQTTTTATASNQSIIECNTAGTSERLHTSAVADDVHIKSVISSETQAKATLNNRLNIDSLLSQLSTTHAEVDQYSRAHAAEINEQVQQSIAGVLARTKGQQEELLVDANRRHLVIDNEYKLQLQKAVEALDAAKAKMLADLERELQVQQKAILAEAKREIDVLNDQANAAKLHALVEAQEKANKDVANLADQVAAMGQLDTQNLLQSKTTTIITSQAQAAGNTEATVAASATNSTAVALKESTELVSTTTANSTTTEKSATTTKDNTTF